MFSTADARDYFSDHGIWTSGSAIILLILYLTGLGIYRVFLSPMAKFPGPKLAALTTCYQAYYDIWVHGQYFKKLDALHAEHGPIVRINPHELHVSDPNFINELYAGPTKKRDKYKWMVRATQLPESTVATISHELHRRRRAALNPYFSKSSIRRLEPVVQETLEKLLKRFSAYAKTGDIMPLNLAYKATTNDIIAAYCFGVNVDYLNMDNYNRSFFETVAAFQEMLWWIVYIPWLGSLMNSIPAPFMDLLMPDLGSLWQMHRQWFRQIKEISASKDLATNNGTVFHGILNSDLPPSEKAPSRLRQEAQLLVLAGQESSASSLSAITFELLANPDKLRKLKHELAAALPDPNAVPTSTELEKLPYLTAVIQEGLRLHPNPVGRLQRVSPDTPLVYSDRMTKKEWVIPAGTPVSMDARTTHMDSTVFPEPLKFLPERWIDNPNLDRYLLTFSKGTRMCAGINLAYAELYLIIGRIFHKYDLYDGTGQQRNPTLELYDTIRERDVDATFDFVASAPAKGSKGVRIAVREGRSL